MRLIMVFSMRLWHQDGTKRSSVSLGLPKAVDREDCGILEKGGLQHPGAGNALLEMWG
jgi:hypothetical protein